MPVAGVSRTIDNGKGPGNPGVGIQAGPALTTDAPNHIMATAGVQCITSVGKKGKIWTHQPAGPLGLLALIGPYTLMVAKYANTG